VARDPTIHDIFDKQTGSWQYIVADPSSLSAVIIDPVLDYDANTGTISTSNADQLLSLIKEKGYRVDMILETHAHADHLTAASYLQKQLSASQGIDKPFIAIGKRITQVQKMFGQRYGVPLAEYDGIFDKLFDDDEAFHVGGIEAMAMHIPGHTPDHMGYRIGGTQTRVFFRSNSSSSNSR
jgi:glyoxylase-like metal-dependent hydrolase (beta-lactamase superfamily II)